MKRLPFFWANEAEVARGGSRPPFLQFKRGLILLVALLAGLASVVVPLQAGEKSGSIRQAIEQKAREADVAFSSWRKSWNTADLRKPGHDKLLVEGERLAIARRKALKELIESDPREALAISAESEKTGEVPDSVSRHFEQRIWGSGSLTVLVSDDFDHGSAAVIREAVVEGRKYRAFASKGRRYDRSQRELPVNGIAIDDVLALNEERAAGSGPVYGDNGGGSGMSAGGFGGGWTQGIKTVLLMRVAFSDDPGEPISAGGGYAMMDQVNQFYIENSYGATAIVPDVTPLLLLPHSKADYGSAGRDTLQDDARTAAVAAGFDSDSYDLDIVIFHAMPGTSFSGWNGLANVGSKGVWMQGTTSAGVAAHELGHNYGLYHANSWSAAGDSIIGPGSTVEYGNPFDTMGHPQTSPGQYHFNAEYKSQLNWLPQAALRTVASNGVYRLYAFDTPQIINGQTYALRVHKDSTRKYWLSIRQKITSNPWLQSGILLDWDPWDNGVANSLNGTDLLDTTPGTPTGDSGLDDCALLLGRTFADPGAGIFVTPIKKGTDTGGNWIDVQVNLGVFTSNSAPTLQISADQTNVGVNVPVSFVATASDTNGDTLAFYWDFGDLTFGSNSANAMKSWNAPGDYVVRCTASDMKGGISSRSLTVTVGTAGTFRVTGRVTSNGSQPIEGARVWNGLSGSSYRGAYTDSDGYYALVNLTAGSYSLSAVKYGYTLSQAGWTNQVTITSNLNSIDWAAASNPIVSVSPSIALAAKPAPTAVAGRYTISRTGPLSSSLTVKFNLNGTAGYQTDYTLSPPPSGSPYQVTLPTGVAATNLMLTPLDSTETNGTETATLTLIENAAYVFGPLAEATVTVLDNRVNQQPMINVSADQDSVLESGPSSGVIRFSRDLNTTNSLVVYYSVSGTASNGIDYAALPGAIVIPAGQTDAVLAVTPIDDLDVEGDETVTLTVLPDPAYDIGWSPNATVTIIDDDPASVFITTTNDLPLEGSGSAGSFEITRIGSMSANLLINYALSGSATNGIDYALLPGAVLIPAGQATAPITVSPIVNSALSAGNRIVVATVSGSPTYNVINPGSAMITIVDSALPRISLSVGQVIASESGASTGQFTFTRTGSTTNALMVTFRIDGNAINGVDYANISNSIVIPAGTNSASLAIVALADTIREGNETVVLTLQPSPAYSTATTTPQTVTIADNNSGSSPGIGFAADGASGLPNQTVVPVYVCLSATNAATVTVNYSVTGGTAVRGTDFVFSPGSLTFAPGVTNKFFNLLIVQSTNVVPDKTVIISLSNASNAQLGARSNFVYTILGDAPSGLVTVTAVQPNASEQGPVPGVFRISRSGGTNTDLPVSYQLSGTASSASDYVTSGSPAVIPAGASNFDVVIMPIDDDIPESTESVILTLTSVAGALIGSPNSATVWIEDNDSTSNSAIVSIVASDPTASWTGPAPGSFTISRDRNTNTAMRVSFTVGGSAIPGADYLPISNAVVIPAGAMATTIAVIPTGGMIPASNRTVVATLTITSEYRVAPASSSATVTIITNHAPVAGTDHFNALENHSRIWGVNELLTNDNDPDGDPVSIAGIDAFSTKGGGITLIGTNVTYTPFTNFTGADQFTYIASDGRGGSATGMVLVTVWDTADASINRFTSIALTTNVLLNFAGVPGFTYSLERSTDMLGWTVIGAGTAGTNGMLNFQDADFSGKSAFYRAFTQ